MRISKIVFTVEPWHQPFGEIHLQCTLSLDGEELRWEEIVEETDFETRFDRYIDYMKEQIRAEVLKEKTK